MWTFQSFRWHVALQYLPSLHTEQHNNDGELDSSFFSQQDQHWCFHFSSKFSGTTPNSRLMNSFIKISYILMLGFNKCILNTDTSNFSMCCEFPKVLNTLDNVWQMDSLLWLKNNLRFVVVGSSLTYKSTCFVLNQRLIILFPFRGGMYTNELSIGRSKHSTFNQVWGVASEFSDVSNWSKPTTRKDKFIFDYL